MSLTCITKRLLANCRVVRFISVRNYPAPKKRFYKNVSFTESEGKFEINLDKRKLRTPLGNVFQLPNEALASAVATEWDVQQDTIKQHNMHLTSLCNTALDNPCHQSKEVLADNILEFLVADTLCYRSCEPPEFLELQKQKWDPIIDWFKNRYRVKVNACEDLSSVAVPKETLLEIKRQLLSYNDWSLLGISFATENLKSLISTLALVNHEIDVEAAVELSRLETIFQVNHWGNVEWSHDIEKAQTTARVAAAVLFAYLNEGSTSILQKAEPCQQAAMKTA